MNKNQYELFQLSNDIEPKSTIDSVLGKHLNTLSKSQTELDRLIDAIRKNNVDIEELDPSTDVYEKTQANNRALLDSLSFELSLLRALDNRTKAMAQLLKAQSGTDGSTPIVVQNPLLGFKVGE